MQWSKHRVVMLVCICVFWSLLALGCDSKEHNDLSGELNDYLLQLDKDPSNCFLLSQIAGIYGALYDIDNQIIYYEKTIYYCPNDFLSRFQLGISYYLKNNPELGIKYMDKAIEDARLYGRNELAVSLEREKLRWLEKHDLVNKLNWNKLNRNQKKELMDELKALDSE